MIRNRWVGFLTPVGRRRDAPTSTKSAGTDFEQTAKRVGPEGVVEYEWPAPEISRLVSAGHGESFGGEIVPRQGFPRIYNDNDFWINAEKDN